MEEKNEDPVENEEFSKIISDLSVQLEKLLEHPECLKQIKHELPKMMKSQHDRQETSDLIRFVGKQLIVASNKIRRTTEKATTEEASETEKKGPRCQIGSDCAACRTKKLPSCRKTEAGETCHYCREDTDGICRLRGAVYIITCQVCNEQLIGKWKGNMARILGRHRSAWETGSNKYSVIGQHRTECHPGENPPELKYDWIHRSKPPRTVFKLLKAEVKARQPKLNEIPREPHVRRERRESTRRNGRGKKSDVTENSKDSEGVKKTPPPVADNDHSDKKEAKKTEEGQKLKKAPESPNNANSEKKTNGDASKEEAKSKDSDNEVADLD